MALPQKKVWRGESFKMAAIDAILTLYAQGWPPSSFGYKASRFGMACFSSFQSARLAFVWMVLRNHCEPSDISSRRQP
jgi:hypothetical protein